MEKPLEFQTWFHGRTPLVLHPVLLRRSYQTISKQAVPVSLTLLQDKRLSVTERVASVCHLALALALVRPQLPGLSM